MKQTPLPIPFHVVVMMIQLLLIGGAAQSIADSPHETGIHAVILTLAIAAFFLHAQIIREALRRDP